MNQQEGQARRKVKVNANDPVCGGAPWDVPAAGIWAMAMAQNSEEQARGDYTAGYKNMVLVLLPQLQLLPRQSYLGGGTEPIRLEPTYGVCI